MGREVEWTRANVPTVVWAYRSPSGKRWCHATLWRQPSTPTRLVVWSDRGRERLTSHAAHEEAVREAERLRARLEANGWTFEASLDTGRGWVVVEATTTLGQSEEDVTV